MSTSRATIFLIGLTAGTLSLGTGCHTLKEAQPLTEGPPPAVGPCALVIGELTVTEARLSDPERQEIVNAFKLGLEKWCAEHKGLEMLMEPVSSNLPPGVIVLDATIGEVEKGSAAARFWIGFGAGQRRAVGNFVVHSLDGTKLITFTARKSYWGDQGIGGWSTQSLEELLEQLGQFVAETIDRWVQKGKIH